MHSARDPLEVRLKQLSARHVASVRTSVHAHSLVRSVAMMHELVMDVVGEQGMAPAGPLFARFHHGGEDVDVEAGLPLAQPIRPVGVVLPSRLPGGPVLSITLDGDHRGHESLRAALIAHALRHGYGVRGAPWESWLVDERDTEVRSEWVTEICLPVVRSFRPSAAADPITPLRGTRPSSEGVLMRRVAPVG